MRTFKDFIVNEDKNNIPWFKSLKIDDIDKEIQGKEYEHYDNRYIKLKIDERQLRDILKKLGITKLKTIKGVMSDEIVFLDEFGEEIARFFKDGGFEKYDYDYLKKYKNDLSYAMINGKHFLKHHKTPLMLKQEKEKIRKEMEKYKGKDLRTFADEFFFGED